MVVISFSLLFLGSLSLLHSKRTTAAPGEKEQLILSLWSAAHTGFLLLSPFSSSFLLFIGTLSPAVCRDIENSPSEDNQLFKSNSHDEEQKAFRQNKHIDRDTEFRGLKAVA